MANTIFPSAVQRRHKHGYCLLILSSLVLSGHCAVARSDQGETPALPKDTNVQIVEEKDGETVTLYARLTNCTEATITLTMNLKGMTASTSLPLTVDATGRSSFELVTIQPTDSTQHWNYSYHYQWKPGRRGNVTQSSFAYALPYVRGSYVVVQGPLGKFSHYQGSGDENAIDWAMPVGTTVCAARDGTVVGIREDSDVGGPDLKFKGCHNYVIIRHDDGTFAEYCHLKGHSVLVELGQKVRKHDPLALSGNTGYSSRPHLHFAVFCTIDGNKRRTIPVKFRTPDGKTDFLKEGDVY